MRDHQRNAGNGPDDLFRVGRSPGLLTSVLPSQLPSQDLVEFRSR